MTTVTWMRRALGAAAVAVLALAVTMLAAAPAHADPASRWLVNDTTGSCLDLDVEASTFYAVGRACNALRPDQRWTVRAIGSSEYLLVHESTGKCLRANPRQPTEGTRAYLETCPPGGQAPRDGMVTWWQEQQDGGSRFLAGGRYSLTAEGAAVTMRYKYRGAGTVWTARDLRPSGGGKPGEGGSCGIRACPPPSDI